MARNIEIKARVADLNTIRAKVAALATAPAQLVEQTDTFFVVPEGRLKVRAFADGSGELIAYERADAQGARESAYARVACQDARAVLQALGSVLPVRAVVSKRREVFLSGRTRIHLDRVDGLGCFVELEAVLQPGEPAEHGHRDVYDLLRALNISEAALVAEAYVDLLEGSLCQPELPPHRPPLPFS